jgi:hypothetical protein
MMRKIKAIGTMKDQELFYSIRKFKQKHAVCGEQCPHVKIYLEDLVMHNNRSIKNKKVGY